MNETKQNPTKHQGHTMNNQKPLTYQDLQIPCNYGVYECISAYAPNNKLPARLLGTYQTRGRDCIVVIIQSQNDEHVIFYNPNDIGRYLSLIERPKKTRQITYEDLAKLDWAVYYYRSNLFKFTFPVKHVGTLYLTCPDAAERVFAYDELDGYLLPRPFAPESEWVSTTVTE